MGGALLCFAVKIFDIFYFRCVCIGLRRMVEQQWGLQPLVPTGKSKPLNFGSFLFRTILKSTKFCSSLNRFSFSSSSDCTDCFFKVVSASTPNLCPGLSSASQFLDRSLLFPGEWLGDFPSWTTVTCAF